MKRALLLVSLVLLCLPTAVFAKPHVLYVQVKSGDVRATPSYLGKLVGTAGYGIAMTIEENKGSWMKVASADGKLSGWMHASLLTKEEIKMNASDNAELAASSGEMALATKGFNSDVEKAFKNKNPNVSFEWVDKMEAIKVKDSDIAKFIKDGDIKPKEGE